MGVEVLEVTTTWTIRAWRSIYTYVEGREREMSFILADFLFHPRPRKFRNVQGFLKSVLFHTLFMTWPKIQNPIYDLTLI